MFCFYLDDVCVEEDHDDTEYNFMAEANQKEEKEEYRNDRAVRITRKLNANPLKLLTVLLLQHVSTNFSCGLDMMGHIKLTVWSIHL